MTQHWPELEAILLTEIRTGAPLRIACDLAGVGVSAVKRRRQRDPEFRVRLIEAHRVGLTTKRGRNRRGARPAGL